MKRILITGGTGYLGSVLVRQARERGDVVAATYFTRPPALADVAWLALDIRDPAAIGATLDQVGPDLVINTAFRQHGYRRRECGPGGGGAGHPPHPHVE
jgi:dTDP-4-dehydrorhamnose reductase